MVLEKTQYGLCQVKMCLRACTKCTDSDYPVYAISFILVFALYLDVQAIKPGPSLSTYHHENMPILF